MTIHHLDRSALVDELEKAERGASLFEPGSVLVVPLDDGADPPVPGHLPWVIVGLSDPTARATSSSRAAPRWCDVIAADSSEVADISGTVGTAPLAAVTFVQVLRGSTTRSVPDGLFLESTSYSMLQAGPEFARWRASRPVRTRPAERSEPVRMSRDGDVLHLTLDRPHVRNALDAAMRNALIDALTVASLDDTISTVHLRAAGPDYSSGGDLDEFGSFTDPVSAHLIRVQASIARLIDSITERVVVHLHGACYGSGIELPAFAHRVIAANDTRIALPEISLGLIPGAGGTVSLPRRVGRHRTAWLGLTGRAIDATTACAWGLVDDVESP